MEAWRPCSCRSGFRVWTPYLYCTLTPRCALAAARSTQAGVLRGVLCPVPWQLAPGSMLAPFVIVLDFFVDTHCDTLSTLVCAHTAHRKNPCISMNPIGDTVGPGNVSLHSDSTNNMRWLASRRDPRPHYNRRAVQTGGAGGSNARPWIKHPHTAIGRVAATREI